MTAAWWESVPPEVGAGAAAAIAVLPTALASGLLAYAPFGGAFSARGAAAGLIAAVVGGFVAALAARSSFIVSVPRSGTALVQAGLAATLVAHHGDNLALGLFAMTLCLFAAGLCQIAMGLLGIGSLIRFTPHPVLAGFLNGLAILIALGALRVLLRGAEGDLGVISGLSFATAVAALIFYIENRKWRIPGAIVGFAVGTAAFYALRAVAPDLPLGPTMRGLEIDFARLLSFPAGNDWASALGDDVPVILLTALVIALVGSLESLLIQRMANNLHPMPPETRRYLVAQGLGNLASAATGGIALGASPSQTVTAFRAGGRTRFVGAAAAVLLLIVVISAPGLLAGTPQVVVCAILFVNAYRVVDGWSVGLLGDALLRRAKKRRGGTLNNLAVVVAVAALTATTSVTVGVFTGIVMSCIIFIVDMSRPLVRRRVRGDAVASRRVRPERDAEILRRSGVARIVLDLEGVMFFGNTDDLCTEIEALFKDARMILVDFQRVASIDVSAMGALAQAMAKARARKKLLFFCDHAAPHLNRFGIEPGSPAEAQIFDDRDTALEWMEELALLEAGSTEFEEVPLDRVEFLDGFAPGEIEIVRTYLMPMSFPEGTILCRETEEADYLWILSSGSVSLLVGERDGQPGKRIASLARGTIVGEMTFLAGGTREATVRADEYVTGYMIDRETFDALLSKHPAIGEKILANIGREIARRLRGIYQSMGAEAGGP